ncbi:MAG: HEPN domain-containing protein [Gemmatimonadetes bacterium]|nr:HEPN domain-containing protein [Gemmatimonadota bacterium]MBI2538066.1 HEPN domain-containing protein [Gemmatimonadota bacterium]
MPGDEKVVVVVREWVEKAENDVVNAAHTLKLGRRCPTDTVCFHAQQSVEKYLKALLTLLEIDSPRTHSVDALLWLIPSRTRPTITDDEQDRLSEYATVTRYPGDYQPISLAEARRAVRLARRVRRDIRRRLPDAALRPRKR